MRRGPWLAALALAAAGCSQLAAPPPGGRSAPPAAGAPAAAPATQALYRVHYDGPEGDGSLRLVRRQVAADRFQLRAADTFGRAVWSLDVDGDRVLLLDHRRREACVAGAELRVPEIALRPLPLPAVARVLDLDTPVAAPADADPADWTDASGQRWTARWEDGELAAWVLWQAGEPQLWWTRQPRGGILSHREGSQFRWRLTASEELAGADYRRLEAPAGYRFGACRSGAGEPAREE